jgi:hypothetical protein
MITAEYDPSLTLEEFARMYMGGCSTKTARRRVLADRIPYVRDQRRILVRRSDAEKWREGKTVTAEVPNLKSLLNDIAAKAARR